MKPTIAIPCPANWDEMKIGQLSRHCNSCAKDVIDFTQQSRHEILAYLIEHRNKEVCGRVRSSQLDYRHEEILVTIRDLEKKHRNTNLSWYLLTMATLSLMSCESEPPKKTDNHEIPVIMGELDMRSGEKQPEIPVEKPSCQTPESSYTTIYSEPHVSGLMEVPPPLEIPAPPVKPEEPIEMIVGDMVYAPPRMIAEVMPEFEGGTDALMAYIQQHLKYPRWEKKHNVQGTVYATFVVDESGKINNARILKSVPGSKNFDKEVLKLIENMPDWKPGKDKGIPTAVQFNLPFRFEL